MSDMVSVHAKPCSGCPYRKDCPSGVWDRSEYKKLAEYDKDSHEQPMKVFLCHDGDRKSTLCRGWLDCHDKTGLISLRLAVAMGIAEPEIFDLPKSDVLVFSSGREAMEHGMRQIRKPSMAAKETQAKLIRRHPELGL